ncbi:hypothetical protein [Oscillibacter sp. MSJ-31]|uniref:hypothetical protein n=1 Tax=Oscillibacter sp. MSJ-31 TaxID=2841526 RepID=UPI001C118A05|nr:hypothetical protein [Oscillibacter sp. MSJ-31]MBU5457553.1 hypothetical protein [Oscillibacter sp. MSJ-31]
MNTLGIKIGLLYIIGIILVMLGITLLYIARYVEEKAKNRLTRKIGYISICVGLAFLLIPVPA